MATRDIVIIGAAEHNLQHVNCRIPRGTFTVVTGVSGSGKSSLAFDTIYAEGQRRYVESLSAYARQFLDQMPKPHIEHIEGLSPAISIEQKTTGRNPRSTVGTVTEIYDFLRVLFAGIGRPHCPKCGAPLERQTAHDVVEAALALPKGTRLLVLAPVVRGRKGEYQKMFQDALRDGYVRAKIDGEVVELDPAMRLKKQLKHSISIVLDRVVVGDDARERLMDSVAAAFKRAEGLVAIDVLPARAKSDKPDGSDGPDKSDSSDRPEAQPAPSWLGERLFSESMACPEHGPQLLELSPRSFSFNSPYGACPRCSGIGSLMEIDEARVVPDPSLSIREGAIAPWRSQFLTTSGRPKGNDEEEGTYWGLSYFKGLCKALRIDLAKPWANLTDRQRRVLLYGSGAETLRIEVGSGHSVVRHHDAFEGVIPWLQRLLDRSQSDELRDYYGAYMSEQECPECRGARLKGESRAVTVAGRSISEVCRHNIGAALAFFDDLHLTDREAIIARQPLKQITDRLGFLLNVGLGYLTLDRAAGTLSGGEAQRVRLATQIGSQLTGVLYVLDEPSIGLHQRDNERLIKTLKALRDLGNTVIVVEHDEQTIRASNYVLDLGPGAGRLGGRLVAAGSPGEIERCADSVTGRYLSGAERIDFSHKRRAPDPKRRLVLRGAAQNNLQGIDIEFPLGLMIGVTGVSGAGKSSLIVDTLWPALANHFNGSNHKVGAHAGIKGLEWIDKVIDIDQSPIGRTPRSNPVTYTKTFDLIRDLFARLPEAQVRGYAPGRFSFNVKGGRCEVCEGGGAIKVEMHFLPDVYVECAACGGRRFNRETLEVRYRGKSIADVLAMTIEEAVEFFDAIPQIQRKLATLRDVGLDYITLGQSATTLSGGEAQRIKLGRELSKKNTGRTVYILDEPTTGLHFADVRKLLEALQCLVDAGSTVVIIEHNLDVIRSCDWLIDLGPEGGDAGGQLVACGPPEAIAANPASYTGRWLAHGGAKSIPAIRPS